MGLGKTVMVLALLDARRHERGRGRHVPSHVVVPRSLIFNWMEEARRFAPKLALLDYTGPLRDTAGIPDADLVLTTYGTLRRDAARLHAFEFDYAILDEAQAIKNAATASAKAARLLRASHRLALSGTPIENHLGELWSLFEFLNPGLLGTAKAFQRASTARRDGDVEWLSRALRPFILRRTKEQVAPELPPRTEQTLQCELEGMQRRHYDELRAHYRETLLARIARDGVNRSKMQILEALLRLRQAACHSGLIDPRRAHEPSAKFDVLIPRLGEVIEEGHKALVFSQFTSFLALLRPRLEALGIPYEYLDGRTRDRAARVDRFQTDPKCRVFLISLKAGGLGLNLTAAEYVFLLDPWWNPAVEAQAIDRAHRIGQARHVFAYRLLARDTVEEKVAELQQSKRQLADAILSADAGLVRTLKPEDLELLLS
jgi:SNF2 family DNA or RNA helicase